MQDQAAIARKNTKLAYVIIGLENASWILPIWILFYSRQLGLSITGAIAFGMARWSVTALCNIPTGAWADRFGRVKLYRLGMLFSVLSYLPFFFTKNIPLLVSAQVIGGFFDSMTMETLEPLVKDGYDLTGQPTKKYKHFISTSTVILYISRLLAGVGGAWFYAKHPYGPYALTLITLAVALILSLFLQELRFEQATAHSNRQHIKEAITYVWQHSYMRKFFFSIMFVVIATESIWTGLQPAFTYRHIGAQYFGLLFAVVALLSALAAYLARKIPEHINGIKVLLYMCIGALAGALLLLVPNKWMVVAALVPLGFAFGFNSPIIYSEIQKHTSSKYQSTVLSASSLLYSSMYIIASLAVGRYVDLLGTGTAIKILSIQSSVCAVVIGAILLTLKNKKGLRLIGHE